MSSLSNGINIREQSESFLLDRIEPISGTQERGECFLRNTLVLPKGMTNGKELMRLGRTFLKMLSLCHLAMGSTSYSPPFGGPHTSKESTMASLKLAQLDRNGLKMVQDVWYAQHKGLFLLEATLECLGFMLENTLAMVHFGLMKPTCSAYGHPCTHQ